MLMGKDHHMISKQKLIVILILFIALLAAGAFKVVTTSMQCSTHTENARPSTCMPPNNRCTPPGDANEAKTDCTEFKYYEILTGL